MMKYVVTLCILTGLAGGCDTHPRGHVEPEPSASTSAAATGVPRIDQGPEPTYTMPPNLCSVISWTAFTDAYPDQPVRQMTELGRKDEPGRVNTAACTAFVGQAADGLFLTIEAKVYAQDSFAKQEFQTWRSLDARRLSDLKGVDAIGSAAYSMSDRILGPALVVLHGNALFRFSVRDLGTAGHIPLGDPPQHLRAMATATLAGLPQTRPPTAPTWPPSGPQP